MGLRYSLTLISIVICMARRNSREGSGVDAVGGAEAIISHVMSQVSTAPSSILRYRRRRARQAWARMGIGSISLVLFTSRRFLRSST